LDRYVLVGAPVAGAAVPLTIAWTTTVRPSRAPFDCRSKRY
jgi:hypothetical protein